MQITQTGLKEASSITSLLTVLSALPYEKDVMMLIPPSIAPKVVYAAALATVLLRLLPRIARVFGVDIPADAPKKPADPFGD